MRLCDGEVLLTLAPWAELLEKLRGERRLLRDSSRQVLLDQFHDQYLCHFPALFQQLLTYSKYVQQLDVETEKDEELDSDSQPLTLPKQLIIETRAALRFGQTCISFENSKQEKSNLRQAIQREAVVTNQLHLALCGILETSSGDAKCRSIASRMLCNLVTANYETALLVTNSIALSLSEEMVSSRIMGSTSLTANKGNSSINWVDMMLSSVKTRNRESFEAIVASLHNALLSLHSQCEVEENEILNQKGSLFALKIASDKMLMSTMVRQIISVNAIKNNIKDESKDGNRTKDSLADGATEWIALLLENVCWFGMLPHMYASAGGSQQQGYVTPEQIILLHCVGRLIEDATHPSNASLGKMEHPFGSEDDIVVSHTFLANQACAISNSLAKDNHCSSNDQESDKPEIICQMSAHVSILEILASSLGAESQLAITESRLFLGTSTSLLPDVARDLGKTVDALSKKNHGRKARELDMSVQEQRLITVLVRTIGNLCYQCRGNQDLMRSTIIPFFSQEGVAILRQDEESVERTALHVLLSCTSFSYGCFTLREWSILALRNALDNNEENQNLVEKLEAQQPVATPELQKMGVQVELDRKGQVRVVPVANEQVEDSSK